MVINKGTALIRLSLRPISHRPSPRMVEVATARHLEESGMGREVNGETRVARAEQR